MPCGMHSGKHLKQAKLGGFRKKYLINLWNEPTS